MKPDTNEIKWCPTQHGNCAAFDPEWRRNGDDEWKPIPVERKYDGRGIPESAHFGGLFGAVGLCGYEQAMALAWGWAAQAAAVNEKIQVRVQEYEFIYDIKARKILEE